MKLTRCHFIGGPGVELRTGRLTTNIGVDVHRLALGFSVTPGFRCAHLDLLLIWVGFNWQPRWRDGSAPWTTRRALRDERNAA